MLKKVRKLKSIRNWIIRKDFENFSEQYDEYTERFYELILRKAIKEQEILKKALRR